MNNYEQLIQRLIEASPSWEKDGGGIRGRTIAPLLGGSSGANVMEESSPQVFNQQINRSFEQQEDILPRISLPTLSSSAVPHPWQIVFRTEGNNLQFKVDLNSKLYKSLDKWEDIDIDGLDDWKTASVGYVILFGVITDGECTEASIQGPQEVPSDRIEFLDGPNDNKIQNSFATLLGYFYEDGDGNIAGQQIAFHNFTLMQTCIDGNPALYPFAT